MSLSRQRSLLLLLLISLCVSILSVHAQEEPTGDILPLSTVLPTEEPSPVTPDTVATEAPTEFTPAPTDEPTLAPTEDEVAPTDSLPTVEREASETSETPAPTQEPILLPVAYSNHFDAGTLADLSLATNWTLVDVTGGKALQSGLNAAAIPYTRATFVEGAVEARFLLNAGEGQVLFGSYTAALNSAGLLTLSRGTDVPGTYQATLTPGEWNKVRLQVVAGQVQVSLNDSVVIAVVATGDLVEGFAGFAASSDAALRVDDFVVYGTPMTLYTPAPITTQETPTEAITEARPAATTEVAFLPAMLLPGAGETLTLTASTTLSDKITVAWNDLSSEEHYDIEQSFDGGTTWSTLVTLTADVTNHEITSLTCGEIRSLRVRGYTSAPAYEELALSGIVMGRTLECKSFQLGLRAPGNGSTLTQTITPLLRWTAIENATSYEVQISTSQSFIHYITGYPKTVTDNFHISAELPNGTYFWRVRVITPTQMFTSSDRHFIISGMTAPTNFQSLGQYSTTVYLMWSDTAGEEGYIIEESDDGTTWTTLTTTAADVTSYQITGLECNYEKFLRIRSFVTIPSYKTSYGLPILGETGRVECPVTIVEPANDTWFMGSLATFSWEAVPNTTSYELIILNNSYQPISGYPQIVEGLSYIDEKLPNGQYKWAVRTKSPVTGIMPSTSTYRTVQIEDRPSPIRPTNFLVSNGTYHDRVRLTWGNVLDNGGYAIEESYDRESWTQIATVPKNTITYDIMTISNCMLTPYYRLRAISKSKPDVKFAPILSGNEKQGKLMCPTLVSPPNSQVRLGNDFSFNWVKTNNTTHYMLDISTSETFDSSLPSYPRVINLNQGGTNINYYPNEALHNGTYYWRVRSQLPTQSYYTEPFKFTINVAIMPDPPVLLFPSQASIERTTRPTFIWQSVPNGMFYQIQVDDDPTFKSPAFSTTTNQPMVSTASEVLSDFSQGLQYWRARSMHRVTESSLTEAYSLWSSPQQFTINPALSPTPNSAFVPAAGRTTVNVTFSWMGVPDPMLPPTPPAYTVQVAPDPIFASPTFFCVSNSATVKSCTISNIPLGVYYWRVLRSGEIVQTPDTPVSNRFVVVSSLPRSPVLTSPTTNRLLQPHERPDVTFTWNWGAAAEPAGGPFTYDIEISTSKTFNVEHADASYGLTAPSYLTEPLSPLPSGLYHWHVRAVSANGVAGAWSAPFSFTLDNDEPDAPAIKTPLVNALVTTARPTFTWAAAPGANRYVLEVNESCGDGSPLYTSPILTTLTHTIPATHTLPQGEQVVCIKALDAAGNEGDFGEHRTFTVFLGTAPAANAFILSTSKITFSWTATPGTTSYLLQVDNDTDWGDNQGHNISLGPVATYAMLPATLTEGTYYWRVIRTGPIAEVLNSNVYRTLYVGTLQEGPFLTAPTLNQPINEAVTLSWNEALAPLGTDITSYQVEVSKSATFVPLLTATTVTVPAPLEAVFTPQINQNNIRHYWRVRGLVNGAPVTTWRSSSFMVDTVPPALPVVSLPTENALLNTVRPTITWAAVPGATRYRLEIVDSANGNAVVVPEQTTTLVSFPVPNNLPQSDLVLRLRAEDTINEGAWRSVNFKVRLGTLPAQNAVVALNRPTFTWLAVPNATAYTLQIDDDSVFDEVSDASPPRSFAVGNVLTFTLKAPELPLPASGAYSWRVMADNLPYPSNDASRTFYLTATTATKPIGLATLANGTTPQSVFNGTTYAAGGITFSWNNVTPKPVLYELEVSTTPTFGAVGTRRFTASVSALATSTLTLTGAQLEDLLKHWRVRAIYSADGTSYGLWSAVTAFTLDQVAPQPPMIPAGLSAVSATNRPTFTWTKPLEATSYYLTVEGTAIIEQPVATTSYKLPTTVLPLPQNTDEGYTWSVVAQDAAGNRSGPSIDSTLYVSVALTPKWAQFLTDQTPTFTWTAVAGTGAAPWTLEIATDQAMQDNVHTSLVGALPATAITFTLPNALGYGQYYWRVYRQGEPLTDLLGQPFYITPVVANAVATPQYPTNGMPIGIDDVEAGLYMQWKTIGAGVPSFADGYLLELSPNATFNPVIDYRLVRGEASLSSNAIYWENLPVVDGKTYYWRVRGLFGEMLSANPPLEEFLELEVGPLGGVYTFKVDLTPPNTPVAGLPVANALITTTRTPTFTWIAPVGAPTRYYVQVSTDAGFTSILSTASVAAPAVTLKLPDYQALANGTYYWRVIAQDAAWNISLPSPGRRLTIAVP